MPEFFQTVMGRNFYEGHFPQLVQELKKANELKEEELGLKHREIKALERANDLKEEELKRRD